MYICHQAWKPIDILGVIFGEREFDVFFGYKRSFATWTAQFELRVYPLIKWKSARLVSGPLIVANGIATRNMQLVLFGLRKAVYLGS
jgi:hypothetical protein